MRAGASIYEVLMRVEDLARHRPISRRLRFLRRAQWWSAEETARYRDARVAALVRHAYETTAYYRRLMDDAGLRPEHVSRVRDLPRLPVLSRHDMHAHAEEMLSSAFDVTALETGASSGSTGEPVRYWHDDASLGAAIAAERWGWEVAGWRAGDRTALVWGNPDTVREEWPRVGPRLKSLVFRELRIPAYSITNVAVADEALDSIARFRPSWLRGYANAIAFLAERARAGGRSMPPCRGVLPMAESLHPHSRMLIEEVFGRVHDGYGASEMGGIAAECPDAGGYHVVEPHVVVEFGEEQLSADGSRELVITNLDEYGMPLLRYKIGDLAVPDETRCACGRAWGKLASVHGRRSELIETPEGGALLSPSFFMRMVLERCPSMTRIQVARTAPDALEMRLVTDDPVPSEVLRRIAEDIEPLLGGMRLSVVRRASLPLSRSGKHQLVVDETGVSEGTG